MGEAFASYDEWKKTQNVDAPFTDIQVERIKAHQSNPNSHPYTCNNGHELEVSEDGLYCLGCNYLQTWVHRHTVEVE